MASGMVLAQDAQDFFNKTSNQCAVGILRLSFFLSQRSFCNLMRSVLR
jgi:hypothetical protein